MNVTHHEPASVKIARIVSGTIVFVSILVFIGWMWG